MKILTPNLPHCTLPAHLDRFGFLGGQTNRMPRLRYVDGGGDGTGAGGSGDGDGKAAAGSAGGGDGKDADADKPLGPEGERALEREKERRREASGKLKTYEDLGMSADDLAKLIEANDPKNPDRIAKQATNEATRAADERMSGVLRKSAIREIAATSGFADPADALAMLSPDKVKALKVDLEEGTADAVGVKTLLDELAKSKPYLLKTKDSSVDHRTAGIGAGGSSAKPESKPGTDRLRNAYADGTGK